MLIHVDIFVKSMKHMLEFYVGKLGMEIVEDSVISGDMVFFVSKGMYTAYRIVLLKLSRMGSMIELIQYLDYGKEKGYIPTTQVTITLLVISLEDSMNKMAAQGIKPVSQIFEVQLPKVGKSKIVFYEDPEKYLFEFLHLAV